MNLMGDLRNMASTGRLGKNIHVDKAAMANGGPDRACVTVTNSHRRGGFTLL